MENGSLIDGSKMTIAGTGENVSAVERTDRPPS